MSVVRDNQYVLADYLISHHYDDKYDIVMYSDTTEWMSPELAKRLKVVHGKAKGLYYRLTSRYVFFAFGSNYMSCYSPTRQITVDLWHGFGLKKIEYEVRGGKKTALPVEYTFNKVVVPSKMFREMVKKSLHCKDEQILCLGTPKVDALFMKSNALEENGIDANKFKKIIYFLPTFRNSQRLGYTGYSHDLPLLDEKTIEPIDEFLRDNNVCLIVKLHHTAQRDTPLNIANGTYTNIFFLSNDDFNKADVHFYSALGKSDALITDYSSVYQDYLAIDKPIGFVIDDIEEYRKLRGFNFDDPLALMPGYKISGIDDFKKFVSDLINDIDLYHEQRQSINDLMNCYHGRENCKNLLDNLGIIKYLGTGGKKI